MLLGIFSVVPPTEPCALRSTQPLKVSTRDFYWGKGGRCVWLTTYHPCSAETSRQSEALTYPEPLGPPRPVAGDLYFYFNVFSILTVYICRPSCGKFSTRSLQRLPSAIFWLSGKSTQGKPCLLLRREWNYVHACTLKHSDSVTIEHVLVQSVHGVTCRFVIVEFVFEHTEMFNP